MKRKLMALCSLVAICISADQSSASFPPRDPRITPFPRWYEEQEDYNEDDKKDIFDRAMNFLDLDSCLLRLMGIKEQACTNASEEESSVYFYLDCSGFPEGRRETYCSGIYCSNGEEIFFTPFNSDFYLTININENERDYFERQYRIIRAIAEKFLGE